MQHILRSMILIVVLGATPAFAAGDGVRMYTVGDATVWAVADSISERGLGIFTNLDPNIANKYMPLGKTPTAIMCYIIKLGPNTILVDTGLGEPAGYMFAGLTQAGFKPEDFTFVLLTHFHGDHIGGLVTPDGHKVFPNAKILSSLAEQAYWLDYDTMTANPERRINFEKARNLTEIYQENFQAFDFNRTVIPGIKALNAGGHTPGHTVFMLESNNAKLLFWADLVHAAALQFPRPEISSSYDMDPEKAAAARLYFMQMAATEKFLIAGAHLPFPGVGRVIKIGENSFEYSPVMP